FRTIIQHAKARQPTPSSIRAKQTHLPLWQSAAARPSTLLRRMLPGGAVGASQQLVGGGVVGDLLFFGVPDELAAELHGEVGEDATGGGHVALFDVGDGFATGGDVGEEIFHV